MTSHCITWHDTTQAITSHQMTWPSHDLTPQQTSRHQNTSLQSTKHHHHGTAEGSFTPKKWFGHRAAIGKFFLCYIVLFLLETSAPGLSGHYWYTRASQQVTQMITHSSLFKSGCSRTQQWNSQTSELWIKGPKSWFCLVDNRCLGDEFRLQPTQALHFHFHNL